MIAKETFTAKWLTELRNTVGRRADPKLLEKVINALALLEHIQQKGFELIFKGGTSLLLMTEQPVRFSIDIDIITPKSKEELEVMLEGIAATEPFYRWEGDNDRRSSPKAPVGHYKFYYKSVADGREEPILLDVLFENNPYPQTREISISHAWLSQEGEPVTVIVPTFESILGDKLTAFAPNTTGILYTKERPVEIIKQLFDVSFLYDRSVDFNIAKESYIRIAREELGYREMDLNWTDVLDDTYDTCFEILNRNAMSPAFQQLQLGIRNITNFIISNFRIDEATVAAGKIACLTGYFKTELTDSPPRYENVEQVKDLNIEDHAYQKYNRLKRTNPEAFYYWYYAFQLKGIN